MRKQKLKVEVDWKLLERIAEYYEFPCAVFLGNEKIFKSRTRNETLIKKAKAFDEISDIIEEVSE